MSTRPSSVARSTPSPLTLADSGEINTAGNYKKFIYGDNPLDELTGYTVQCILLDAEEDDLEDADEELALFQGLCKSFGRSISSKIAHARAIQSRRSRDYAARLVCALGMSGLQNVWFSFDTLKENIAHGDEAVRTWGLELVGVLEAIRKTSMACYTSRAMLRKTYQLITKWGGAGFHMTQAAGKTTYLSRLVRSIMTCSQEHIRYRHRRDVVRQAMPQLRACGLFLAQFERLAAPILATAIEEWTTRKEEWFNCVHNFWHLVDGMERLKPEIWADVGRLSTRPHDNERWISQPIFDDSYVSEETWKPYYQVLTALVARLSDLNYKESDLQDIVDRSLYDVLSEITEYKLHRVQEAETVVLR